MPGDAAKLFASEAQGECWCRQLCQKQDDLTGVADRRADEEWFKNAYEAYTKSIEVGQLLPKGNTTEIGR